MEIANMTKAQALDYLERRVDANEKLIDVLDDTENKMFIAMNYREIFMQEHAFQKVCELFSLQVLTYARDCKDRTYKYESDAYMDILGKRYKLYSIYDLEGEEE